MQKIIKKFFNQITQKSSSRFLLGHSDIRMTSRYTHATDAALHRAVTNLDGNSDFGNVLVTKQKRQLSKLP